MSYSYLANRWGWSKSRVGRFVLKIEEAGIICCERFSSSYGSVFFPCRFREMIYGEDSGQLQLRLIGEILGIAKIVKPELPLEDVKLEVETRVPNRTTVFPAEKSIRIQVFSVVRTSFFARPVPLIFYSSLDWGGSYQTEDTDRGPPKQKQAEKGVD